MADDQRYIALYLRISKDRTGNVEGVERQERWGRAYARRMVDAGTWPDLPIRVFGDNDLSAFDDHVHREQYEALRDEVRAGRIAYVWTVEQARLEANRKRWPYLADELAEAGITELHTDRDGVVRLDEVADIKATLAWHERKRLRVRTNDTLAELAADGRPSGGSTFGYRHVTEGGRKRLVVDETQGPAVAEAAQRVLAGWSLARIARDLAARGVPTARGGVWGSHTVRTFLRSSTICGRRVYKGRVVGAGDWDPLISEETFDAVGRVLDGNRTVAHANNGTYTARRAQAPARRYLLSTIATCAKCRHPLTGQVRDVRGVRCAYYLCRHPGCYGVAAPVDPVDGIVKAKLLGRLRTPAFLAALATGDPHAETRKRLTAELARVKARGEEMADEAAADDTIPLAEWRRARAGLEHRRSECAAELGSLPAPVEAVDVSAVTDGWDKMVLDERRRTIRLFLGAVTVSPRTGGRGFDTSRIEVVDRKGDVL